MRTAELLYAIAKWLESPDNEALLLAEQDSDCLKVVSESCVLAAALLKNAADEVDTIEPPEPSKITSESIEGIANLASALDSSKDPELMAQASVLDELLLSISAPEGAYKSAKAVEDNRIEELRRKYKEPQEQIKDFNRLADVEKAIDKSNMTKKYKVLEAPLSTRYCPDHPGVQIMRIGENTWQCEMDKRIYNFDVGYDLLNGSKIPGSQVSLQNQGLSTSVNSVFDTRQGRLGFNS
jgi:hypothetical protein